MGRVSLNDIFGGPGQLQKAIAADGVTIAVLAPRTVADDFSAFAFDGSLPAMQKALPPVQLSRTDAKRLVALLTREDSYDWTDHRFAAPKYACRVNFPQMGAGFSLELAFNESIVRGVVNGWQTAAGDYRRVLPQIASLLAPYFPSIVEEYGRIDLTDELTSLAQLNTAVVRRQESAALTRLIREGLSRTSSLELLALDSRFYPRKGEPKPEADLRPQLENQWPIKALQLTEKQPEIAALSAAIERDLTDGFGRASSLCFEPHHALRWHDGEKSFLLVICYLCGQGYLETPEGLAWFTLTGTSQATLNQVFIAHGLPVSPSKPPPEAGIAPATKRS
ncbi:MAG TPA: hypothetical protein VHD32_12620 [Candidatus Didemnitutus sp.]|nr:hypothetical protein [Candidatus Didemnitutus sp.]